MSNISSKGIITLMRGDTLITPLEINLGTKLEPNVYKLAAGDTLYFALMEPNQAFEDAIVKKVFTNASDQDEHGNIMLKLSPKDTEQLLVGKYYYMVKLRSIILGEEIVKTVIPPTLFWLQGNNTQPKNYPDNNPNDITRIIYDGGEMNGSSGNTTPIVYDGGVIK